MKNVSHAIKLTFTLLTAIVLTPLAALRAA